MFSFHKPKIYRSNLGCCICKAKSSSSRFTDSKKYENEFERCFRIEQKRSGEICNACVLLVKRWKKLSPENRLTKHWHHVVDARAGPGTKLAGNRRLVAGGGGGTSSTCSSQHEPGAQQRPGDVLPLSSSQSGNQVAAATARTRTSSLSKVRAIDTNVTTFTFGEPYRRNYSTLASSSAIDSYLYGSANFNQLKPQASVFESVLKRFRQRKQQQQLEAQQRQLNKQRRRKQTAAAVAKPDESSAAPPVRKSNVGGEQVDPQAETGQRTPAKRFKRSSESIGSVSVESLRVSSLLDSSIWRKEKICCGIIFRGLYNEVVVFPKLLKPCECRSAAAAAQQEPQVARNQIAADSSDEDSPLKKQVESSPQPPQPPPRTTKSGSISSCDSNTSGTGSMEQPLDERPQLVGRRPTGSGAIAANKTQLGAGKRSAGAAQRTIGAKGRRAARRLLLVAPDEDDDDEEGDDDDEPVDEYDEFDEEDDEQFDEEDDEELILDEEASSDLSNDAASSVESLADKLASKKPGALAMG